MVTSKNKFFINFLDSYLQYMTKLDCIKRVREVKCDLSMAPNFGGIHKEKIFSNWLRHALTTISQIYR
jgi:hypothetical protein